MCHRWGWGVQIWQRDLCDQSNVGVSCGQTGLTRVFLLNAGQWCGTGVSQGWARDGGHPRAAGREAWAHGGCRRDGGRDQNGVHAGEGASQKASAVVEPRMDVIRGSEGAWPGLGSAAGARPSPASGHKCAVYFPNCVPRWVKLCLWTLPGSPAPIYCCRVGSPQTVPCTAGGQQSNCLAPIEIICP